MKWNIGDDDDEQPAPEEAAGASTSSSSKIAVRWPATLSARLNEFHTLTDDERNESGNDDNSSPTVKVPIYQLYYSPLEGENVTWLTSVSSCVHTASVMNNTINFYIFD